MFAGSLAALLGPVSMQVAMAQQSTKPCFATTEELSAWVSKHPPASREEFQALKTQRAAIQANEAAGVNPCAAPAAVKKETPRGPEFRTISVNGRLLTAADGTPVGPGSGVTAGLAFGDPRSSTARGIVIERGTVSVGRGSFAFSYGAGDDPVPGVTFEGRVTTRARFRTDTAFHGWDKNGDAYITVDDALAGNFCVSSDGLVGGSPRSGVCTTGSSSLRGQTIRVHPDYSYEFVQGDAPHGLWINDPRGEHPNVDRDAEKLDAILKHNAAPGKH